MIIWNRIVSGCSFSDFYESLYYIWVLRLILVLFNCASKILRVDFGKKLLWGLNQTRHSSDAFWTKSEAKGWHIFYIHKPFSSFKVYVYKKEVIWYFLVTLYDSSHGERITTQRRSTGHRQWCRGVFARVYHIAGCTPMIGRETLAMQNETHLQSLGSSASKCKTSYVQMVVRSIQHCIHL